MDVDCRGKACPQPVLMVKQALDQLKEGELTVFLDDSAARENVERFAASQGCSVKAERRDRDILLHIRREQAAAETRSKEEPERVVVYINSHLLGIGDEALGAVLMRAFLKTLLDLRRNRIV
jgi:tRNA 2-thiouridine synthesizing protein A